MKNWLFLVGLAAVLLGSGLAVSAADESENFFTKIKILINTSNPPVTRTTATNMPTSVSGTNLRNSWTIFTVEYTPVPPQKSRNVWIDDVTMTIQAIFIGQTEGKALPFIFTGKSEFWTINLDSRKHIARMMIPPHLLDRYLPSAGSGSKVSVASTFIVEVTFTNRVGVVIGRGYYGQKGWSEKVYAEYFEKAVRGNPIMISGAILPPNQTPWAFVDIDDQDLLKPIGISAEGKK